MSYKQSYKHVFNSHNYFNTKNQNKGDFIIHPLFSVETSLLFQAFLLRMKVLP